MLSIYLTWRLFQFTIGMESQPLEERFFPTISFYWEWLNDQLRIALLHATRLCLSLIGYQSVITHDYIITIDGYRGVAIGNYCLGFQFMFFFACIIILSPFSLLVKSCSIPFGWTLIQGLNVFRFVGLNLAIIHFPGLEDKMHDYLFNAAALAVTLLLYMKLLSKYG